MTTITQNNSSTGAALAALISSGSNATVASASALSSSSTAKSGLGPATTVSLSDHAKAVLAKAQADQAVAARLANQITASKSAAKPGQSSVSPTFQQIVASAKHAQPGSAGAVNEQNSSGVSTNIFDAIGDELDAQYQAYAAKNLQSNGTYSNFNVTKSDVTIGSFTSQQADQWYSSIQGKGFLAGEESALANDPTGPGAADAAAYIQAANNHTLVIQSAADVPDLNFHNSIVFQGGETGGAINGSYNYNQSAQIFQDKSKFTSVNGDGFVISWNVPQPTSISS